MARGEQKKERKEVMKAEERGRDGRMAREGVRKGRMVGGKELQRERGRITKEGCS